MKNSYVEDLVALVTGAGGVGQRMGGGSMVRTKMLDGPPASSKVMRPNEVIPLGGDDFKDF